MYFCQLQSDISGRIQSFSWTSTLPWWEPSPVPETWLVQGNSDHLEGPGALGHASVSRAQVHEHFCACGADPEDSGPLAHPSHPQDLMQLVHQHHAGTKLLSQLLPAEIQLTALASQDRFSLPTKDVRHGLDSCSDGLLQFFPAGMPIAGASKVSTELPQGCMDHGAGIQAEIQRRNYMSKECAHPALAATAPGGPKPGASPNASQTSHVLKGKQCKPNPSNDTPINPNVTDQRSDAQEHSASSSLRRLPH